MEIEFNGPILLGDKVTLERAGRKWEARVEEITFRAGEYVEENVYRVNPVRLTLVLIRPFRDP